MTPGRPFEFLHATRRLIHGPGCLDRLADLAHEAGCRRALVILDGVFAGGPLQERIAALLAGQELAVHAVPRHEPTQDTVLAGAGAITAAEPDLVVAIGGGSALDTAKAARMQAANPGPLGALLGAGGVAMAGHASLFVAVPTTAGTGSEVSDSAIIDMPGTIYKAVLRAQVAAPDIALLDPELTISCPAAVTAASGFDALTHAIEAYTSRMAGPMTDPFALSAAGLLAGHLRGAFERPGDIAARSACLIGSTQAGIAFNSAHLGIAHAIAGALGALHHVPHGLANALALPWTMAFNAPAIGDKGTRLARLFGADDLSAGLSRLRHVLGLDQSIDAWVPDPAARDRLAEAAMTSGQIRVNPREVSLPQMRGIVEAMRQPTGGALPELAL